ncbi:NADPH:quinone oxidoreductase [Linum grandiflorum]
MEATLVTTIRIAAISGSLRQGSFNSGLILSAIELSKQKVSGIEIEFVDITQLPMLNTDLEGPGGSYPDAVEAFHQTIREADRFLFASPEYNYSVSAPLKIALDWASRPPNCWGNKAAAIVSAGAGGCGGGRSQYHLRQIGIYIDIHFINKPEFFLNAFAPPAKFDSDGNLIDDKAKENLKDVLVSLRNHAFRLKVADSTISD